MTGARFKLHVSRIYLYIILLHLLVNSDYLPIVQCSPIFLLAGPFWLRKIATDPHILAYVNIECPYDRYPKLNIYISDLILDSYKYVQVAYVSTHCMILP
jgi:hypothetical protein